MRWRSSSSPPRAVVKSLPLGRGERVLAATRDTDGRWHIGSDAALYLGTADGFRAMAWEALEGATWDRETSQLVVLEVAEYGEVKPRHVVETDQPGRFLELVRERITASVLLTRSVPVEGEPKRSVKVVARRSPTRKGDVAFSFLLDDGLDPADHDVREATRAGLVRARDELGL